jgi:hypothetical protein
VGSTSAGHTSPRSERAGERSLPRRGAQHEGGLTCVIHTELLLGTLACRAEVQHTKAENHEQSR